MKTVLVVLGLAILAAAEDPLEKVQLLSRIDGVWRAETLFVDTDKGHWLAVAEPDGRNSTRELISSGYNGRIVMLARPAGYGRPELCGDRSRCPSCATVHSLPSR